MTEREHAAAVGQRIRKLRRMADLSQTELAKRIGFKTAQVICALERGRKVPSAYIVWQIEKELGEVWDYVVTNKQN
jgi:transcriptional regulator with XRE-family HTH domain